MDIVFWADTVAANLRSSGTCAQLCGPGSEFTPRELFDAVKERVPVLGVISTTGRTLHLTLVTERPRHLGVNAAINHRTNLDYARRIRAIDASRVWT